MESSWIWSEGTNLEEASAEVLGVGVSGVGERKLLLEKRVLERGDGGRLSSRHWIQGALERGRGGALE